MTVVADDGTKVRLQTRHKERARGLLRRCIEGLDPLDDVKAMIAGRIGERLAAQVREGTPAVLRGAGELQAQGIRPSCGRLRGTLVPFSNIARLGANSGILLLYCSGEPRPFLKVRMNSRDFWPWFSAMGEFGEAARGFQAELAAA
jgi:hypothetical protein